MSALGQKQTYAMQKLMSAKGQKLTSDAFYSMTSSAMKLRLLEWQGQTL